MCSKMMDDDKPVPPTRNASVRDKNGSTSGDRDREKKRWFLGGKKTSGKECYPMCVIERERERERVWVREKRRGSVCVCV